MKHVIVIETDDELSEDITATVIGMLGLIFNLPPMEMVASVWNQKQSPLQIPNASDDGLTRLADI